jgi:preprotein translocase subunit SecE
MTNSRLVAIGYVVLGIPAGLFLEQVFLKVFGAFTALQPLTTSWGDSDWNWCRVLGLGIAAVTCILLWKRPKTHDASLEIASELRKVSWPSFAETRAATIAVIVASIISALLLGFFDLFWQFLTDKIQNPTL